MRRSWLLVIAGFTTLAAGSVAFCKDENPSRNHPMQAVGGAPVISSAQLISVFSYPNTTITSVTFKTAGAVSVAGIGPMPEHVIVVGKMNERVSPVDRKTYAIGFEMRLPTNWNGRFLYQANGGTDGMVSSAYGGVLGGGPTTNGLLKGFAVISSDAGHASEPGVIGGGLFGIDPQARLDYGYNAVAQLTPMAKALIKAYYGKFPDRSYLAGCSNGGRHAMVAASRYPDQYDGILAGSPGFNLPKAAVAQLWGVQQYAQISAMGANGRPDIQTSFTYVQDPDPAKTVNDLAIVADKVLARCDALDGVVDNMVSDPVGCQSVFDIKADVPTCTGAPDHKTCLTYGQKAVLAAVHRGAVNSQGDMLYTNFLWDVGIRSTGWRSWKFSSSITNRDPLAVGFIFSTPPEDPAVLTGTGTTLFDYASNWDGGEIGGQKTAGFDPDWDAPKIYATNDTYTESAMSFMTPPDLLMKKLRPNNTKLIVFHGAADPVFSVADTINWYEKFLEYYGQAALDYGRFFIVPGMSHCSGGPACDQFDFVDALVKWVEQGTPPDSVVAKARGTGANVANGEVPAAWSPARTRPLCPYPSVAVYNGTGSLEDASSFTCTAR